MDFKIVSTGLDPEEERVLAHAVTVFEQCQARFSAKMGDHFEFHEDGAMEWSAIRETLARSYCSTEDRVIGITSRPFVDNWFSHTEGRITVISVADWRQLYCPPGLHCYLLMEFTVAAYYHASDIGERESQPHDVTTTGCMHDLCEAKSDIQWKLRVGHVCAQHCGLFRSHGGDDEDLKAIESLLDKVREVTLGRPSASPGSAVPYRVKEFTIESLKKHPLVVAATIMLFGIGSGWWVAWTIHVIPKNDRIAELEKQVQEVRRSKVYSLPAVSETPE